MKKLILALAAVLSLAVGVAANAAIIVGPTTAEECKKYGWQAYNMFLNQGDCVAYVMTNGSNEPGQNIPTSQEP